jgi:hypothetical protein
VSADSWATCPRCKANGLREDFREDYETGLNDPENWPNCGEEGKEPCVIFKYRGECQGCGLLVKLAHRFPVTWEPEKNQPEKNEPTGPVEHRPWTEIPAGWFVQAPNREWYEVVSTKRMPAAQKVVLRMPDGRELETARQAQKVPCRAGTTSVPWETMRDVLGAEILEDGP